MSARILMTGSRGWNNTELASAALKAGMLLLDTQAPTTTLIHGAARGADLMLAGEAMLLGMPTEPHPAQWNQHSDSCPDWDKKGDRCKLAGFHRNTRMINSNVDLCLAFPTHPQALAPGQDRKESSRGTWHCVAEASKAGVPTFVIWGRRVFPFGDAGIALMQHTTQQRNISLDNQGGLPLSELGL